jgi:flagellum-specific peptidoglycan hydrolase FlgJ
VKHRRTWQGICIGMMGVALTLAPMTAASAHNKQKHHSSGSTKGSAPNSAMCQKVKTEQTGSSSVGVNIEKAMESGNFAAAKQAMLSAYSTDAANVQKALAVIKTAPSNVQSAFKNLLTFVQQIKTDIQNASSLQGLITSFESLGKNQQLVTDGTTIANWYTGVCGGSLITTTTTSLP